MSKLRKDFERKTRARWHRTRKRWDERTQQNPRMIVHVWSLFDALEDPRIVHGVIEMMTLSLFAAIEDAPDRQCFGCSQPWTMKRSLVGILLVEHLDPKQPSDLGLLAGLCPECFGNSERILAGLQRDIGYTDCQLVSEPGAA